MVRLLKYMALIVTVFAAPFSFSAPVAAKKFVGDMWQPFIHSDDDGSAELSFAQLIRISGSVELKNKQGKLIKIRFAGSTHDWDGNIARESEVGFLTKALLSQNDAPNCDLLIEQAGDDFIPNEIAKIIFTSPALLK